MLQKLHEFETSLGIYDSYVLIYDTTIYLESSNQDCCTELKRVNIALATLLLQYIAAIHIGSLFLFTKVRMLAAVSY